MENCTGIILAGGKSTRMGTDKGLLMLNGKTFISHICESLKPITGDNIIIVSSNTDYDFLGYTRIEDLISDKGPVGGIYTGLKHSKTKMNIVLSVDVPFVTSDLLEWLLIMHADSFMVTQLQENDKTTPLIAVYDRSMRIILGEAIAGNQLKLRSVVEEVDHQTLEVPEKWSRQTLNINTQEDYQNLIK